MRDDFHCFFNDMKTNLFTQIRWACSPVASTCKTLAAAAVLATLLTACGGGGGSSSTTGAAAPSGASDGVPNPTGATAKLDCAP